MTKENDIVLIYVENMPAGFARVESISADSKKDWYHVKLLFLQIPLQTVTWILKDSYINGGEFTMGGKKMRLELVKCPEEKIVLKENSPVDNIKSFPIEKDKKTEISDKKQNKMTGKKEKPQKNKIKNKQAEIVSLADIRKLKKKK